MTAWKKWDFVIRWLGVLLIPLVLAWIALLANKLLSEQKIQQDLVKLSIDILLVDPGAGSLPLRNSAIHYLEKSGFLIDVEGKEYLYEESLKTSIETRIHEFNYANDSFLGTMYGGYEGILRDIIPAFRKTKLSEEQLHILEKLEQIADESKGEFLYTRPDPGWVLSELKNTLNKNKELEKENQKLKAYKK